MSSLSVFPVDSASCSRRHRHLSVTFADQHVPSLQRSSAEGVPDLIFFKPNPADPVQINEPPPQPDRDPGLRTQGSLSLLDRPFWQQQLWQRLQEGVTEDIDEGPVLSMNSYYVCHITNHRQDGGRPLRFDRGINGWESDICFVWEDLVDMNLPIFVHLVHPEPPLAVAPGTFGTLLIVQNPTPYRAACLTTAIEPAQPRFRITEVAHSFDVILPFRHVLLHAGVIYICDQRREQPPFQRCELRVGRNRLPDGLPVRVHEGIGFVISIPPPMSQAEWEIQFLPAPSHAVQPQQAATDESAFLAHHTRPCPAPSSLVQDTRIARDLEDDTFSTSSSTDDESNSCAMDTGAFWRDAIAFSMSGAVVQLQLPWDDALELYRLLAQALSIDYHDAAFVHIVQFPPADLAESHQECILAQTTLHPPSSDILRYILVDVEVYPPGNRHPIVYARRVVWMPHTVNTLSVFRLLGLEEHFRPEPARGHIWLNNDWHHPDTPDPLRIEDGDFLKVVIGDDFLFDEWEETNPPDENSLFQQQLRLQSPNQCQSDYDASDFGTTFPHHRAQRVPPASGPHFDTSRWRRQLHNRFQPQSHIECEEEGGVVYVLTWFVRPVDFPSCPQARPVRLLSDSDEWEDIILEAWADRVQQGLPISAFWVRPQPISTSMSNHIGHLILSQAVRGDLAAILLATHRQRNSGLYIDQVAHLVIWCQRLCYEGRFFQKLLYHQLKSIYDHSAGFTVVAWALRGWNGPKYRYSSPTSRRLSSSASSVCFSWTSSLRSAARRFSPWTSRSSEWPRVRRPCPPSIGSSSSYGNFRGFVRRPRWSFIGSSLRLFCLGRNCSPCLCGRVCWSCPTNTRWRWLDSCRGWIRCRSWGRLTYICRRYFCEWWLGAPQTIVSSVAVQIVPGTWHQDFVPDYIEVASPGDPAQIQRELACWGHICHLHWPA